MAEFDKDTNVRSNEYIKKTDAMSDAMCTGIACRECSFDSVDGCKVSKFFSELPTIDIVHCYECKHHQEDSYCMVINAHTFDDVFCSCGERKE